MGRNPHGPIRSGSIDDVRRCLLPKAISRRSDITGIPWSEVVGDVEQPCRGENTRSLPELREPCSDFARQDRITRHVGADSVPI